VDQDRAVRFFVEKLGFRVLLDVPIERLGSRWIVVAPAEAAATVALIAAHDGVPAGVETGIRFGTDDAAALHADLRARGVEVGELLLWEGVPPMFAFKDHDGNGFEIVQ
jgi:catechol 2,3-dioxygenase-like lactoylglutathione lyase family enzyme